MTAACIAFGAIALASLTCARSNWVLRVRLAALLTDPRRYLQLPSYDEMIWRFWIWDAAKF